MGFDLKMVFLKILHSDIFKFFGFFVLILPMILAKTLAQGFCVDARVTTEEGTAVNNITVYGFLTCSCFLDRDDNQLLCLYNAACSSRCGFATVCSEIKQVSCMTNSQGKCKLCFDKGACLDEFRGSCRVILVANGLSNSRDRNLCYSLPSSGPTEQAREMQGSYSFNPPSTAPIFDGKQFELKVMKLPEGVCGNKKCECNENSENC